MWRHDATRDLTYERPESKQVWVLGGYRISGGVGTIGDGEVG